MSKYRSQPFFIRGLGLSTSTLLIADRARSQSKKDIEGIPTESTAADANRQIQTANPLKSSDSSSTAIGTGNNGSASYTFIMSTPALIAVAVVVGSLAIFPIVSLLWNSKKAAKLGKESFLVKFSDRFRKPQVLESDKFLHQRNFEKLAQITNQAENLNADKFGNTEFMVFFKIKSYIARSMSMRI